MAHCDIAKTIISSQSLSIRKNKIKPFSKEPEAHPEKFLTAQILVCSGKWVSPVGQFDQMSEICFVAELILSFILGSNIQNLLLLEPCDPTGLYQEDLEYRLFFQLCAMVPVLPTPCHEKAPFTILWWHFPCCIYCFYSPSLLYQKTSRGFFLHEKSGMP